MIDSTPPRAWTSGCGGGLAFLGGWGRGPAPPLVLRRRPTNQDEPSPPSFASPVPNPPGPPGRGTHHLNAAALAAQPLERRTRDDRDPAAAIRAAVDGAALRPEQRQREAGEPGERVLPRADNSPRGVRLAVERRLDRVTQRDRARELDPVGE